jgi:hypothetical protein
MIKSPPALDDKQLADYFAEIRNLANFLKPCEQQAYDLNETVGTRKAKGALYQAMWKIKEARLLLEDGLNFYNKDRK